MLTIMDLYKWYIALVDIRPDTAGISAGCNIHVRTKWLGIFAVKNAVRRCKLWPRLYVINMLKDNCNLEFFSIEQL